MNRYNVNAHLIRIQAIVILKSHGYYSSANYYTAYYSVQSS